jgi:hypothetical protein
MLPVEPMSNARVVVHEAQSPVCVLFCTSSKYHNLKVLGEQLQERVCTWSDRELAFVVIDFFEMEECFI